nr:putative RNA-dependent RNA polymerase [Poaceae Liege totivirus 2]
MLKSKFVGPVKNWIDEGLVYKEEGFLGVTDDVADSRKKNQNIRKNSKNKNKVNRLQFRFRKDKNIPLIIKINKDYNTVSAVPFRDATHVYVKQRRGIAPENEEYIEDVFGASLICRSFEADGTVFVYARVDQELLTPHLEVHAVMTRHFNGMYQSIDYLTPKSTKGLFRPRVDAAYKSKSVGFAAMHSLPKSKVTANHHIHFLVDEVVEALGPDRDYAKKLVKVPYDANASMAAGVMLWFGSLDKEQQAEILRSNIFAISTVSEFVKATKSLSAEAKSLQNIVKDDLRAYFELDVLVNRGVGTVDWQQEYENRTTPNLANFSYEHVYERACLVFADAARAGRQPTSMDWPTFWANRWQWSASGSIHSQYAEDNAYVFTSDPRLKNKFISISAMPKMELDDLIVRKPAIHAWSSMKYEWGKQRAIYGTDLTSYIMAQLAFSNCEEVLPSYFPVGPDATESNVYGKVSGVLKNKSAYCLDFEDFNSQHSAHAMTAVIHAYVDQFSSTLTEDQRKAAVWTAESITHQRIHDNSGLKREYDAKATLLSGWRLTTFMNSILNYIYTKAICGDRRPNGSSLHNGDDVLIGTRNLETVRMSLYKAKRLNVRVQPSKCAYAGIAEFLRVDHKRGSKGQYLSRGCATLVHSRIESRVSTDERDLIKSMETRFGDVLDRGMPYAVIARLRQVYYRRQSEGCGTTPAQMYKIKSLHRVVGGVSENDMADTDKIVQPVFHAEEELDLPPLPGVYDYATQIIKALDIQLPYSSVVKRLRNATFEAIMEKKRKMNLVSNYDEWYVNVKRIYRAHKGKMSIPNYGKAALVGVTVDLLRKSEEDNPLVALIRRSKRPLELIRLVI